MTNHRPKDDSRYPEQCARSKPKIDMRLNQSTWQYKKYGLSDLSRLVKQRRYPVSITSNGDGVDVIVHGDWNAAERKVIDNETDLLADKENGSDIGRDGQDGEQSAENEIKILKDCMKCEELEDHNNQKEALLEELVEEQMDMKKENILGKDESMANPRDDELDQSWISLTLFRPLSGKKKEHFRNFMIKYRDCKEFDSNSSQDDTCKVSFFV